MNIRADWGFGKTFFLQKWAKDLEHSNYPVVFYDAWANDFCDDPLIGFIAEINDFVVATNLEQLGHSIRAVYGEQFDSERYLKRFFDQEYLLPTPDGTRFTAFLFERYLLNDSVYQLYTVIEDGIYDVPSEQALFTVLADAFNLSLRDQEQVAGLLQAILLSWPDKERVHLAYLLFLIIVKQVSTTLFQQLAENRYNSKPEFLTAI